MTTFPIPMRGNETISSARTAPTVSWFPIPMRGNEWQPWLAWKPVYAAVSDPHEG